MKIICPFIVHLLFTIFCQVKCASLSSTSLSFDSTISSSFSSSLIPTITSSPNLAAKKETKDTNQLNNRILPVEKQLLNNYAINSFQINHEDHEMIKDDQTVNQLIKAKNDFNLNEDQAINHLIKLPSTDQLIQQSLIKHKNCGMQHLTSTGILTASSTLQLSERNPIALSKLVQKSKFESNENSTNLFKNDHLTNKTNKNRLFNFASNFERKRSNSRRGKVVGGNLAYEGEFPWQVSIRKFDNHHCGGVLISEVERTI